jgi:uncharacterized protein
MQKEIQIRVMPAVAAQAALLHGHIVNREKLKPEDIRHIEVLRRSIDARGRQVFVNLSVRLYINEDFAPEAISLPAYSHVGNAEEVIIIGAGPAGLFAALELIENGLKPVIIERGKNVKDRIADLKGINVNHIVNEDSNYCFGEGGAGTYSDGKLYTRSKKGATSVRFLSCLWVSGR